VGHPSAEAIYSILYSCMMELMRADILRPSVSLVDPRSISIIAPSNDDETIHLSYRLFDIARQCLVSSIGGHHLRLIRASRRPRAGRGATCRLLANNDLSP
jgi:hypothetical protein